jgi:hypothetical protein
MRALVLFVVALAGCHDYAHFHDVPDGAAIVADLAGASGDLAGCPTPGAQPTVGSGCVVYTFEAGVPNGLAALAPQPDSSIDPACGMLHVRLGAGASHDLWIDNMDSVRVEEKTPRSGAFTVSARVHGALDRNQKFSGVYAADNTMHRFVSIQTAADSTGLHDHDVVFTFGAGTAEQASYPTATPAAGDSYAYALQRLSDGSHFSLTGSTTSTLVVTAPAAITPGVAVGNCCGGSAPAFDAFIEWMMVCPQ